VYVTIPQGDYSKKKLIIGSYDSSLYSEKVLTGLENKLVNISGNICDSENSTTFYSTNSTTNTTNVKLNIDLSFNALNTGVRTKYLYLSADFKTNNLSNAVEGDYGLALADSNDNIKYILNSSTFIGDPYNFFLPFRQEAIFDVGSIDNVTDYKLLLYHRNNFKDASGNNISVGNNAIEVSNIRLFYGPSAEEYAASKDKKELILWSNTNSYTVTNGNSSQIDIRVKWIREKTDEPGAYETLENKSVEDYSEKGVETSLTLYRYMPGTEDVGAGPHWAKAVKKKYAKDYNTKKVEVQDMTPMASLIGDSTHPNFYKFPYIDSKGATATSAWQTKLDTTG
jgi:hypothetical protein